MLKGVPPIISPELMKALMEMGHGDEIVLGDSNFPGNAYAKKMIRCDGHKIPDLLKAILQFMPLDIYVESPAALMQVVPGDEDLQGIAPIYRDIINQSGEKIDQFEYVERFAFYERIRNAFAVIATSDKAAYANIILKKGVVV